MAFVKFCWVFTLLSCVIAFFALITAFVSSSAPQQAGMAGLAVGFAVIPYVVTRAFEGLLAPWTRANAGALANKGPRADQCRIAAAPDQFVVRTSPDIGAPIWRFHSCSTSSHRAGDSHRKT